MANTTVVIAGDGKPYSAYRLNQLAKNIKSHHCKISWFEKDLNRIITDRLTMYDFAQLMRHANKQDLRRKIIFDPSGRLLDGTWSIVKALFLQKKTIRVARFASWEDMLPAYFPEHKNSARVSVPITAGILVQ